MTNKREFTIEVLTYTKYEWESSNRIHRKELVGDVCLEKGEHFEIWIGDQRIYTGSRFRDDEWDLM